MLSSCWNGDDEHRSDLHCDKGGGEDVLKRVEPFQIRSSPKKEERLVRT